MENVTHLPLLIFMCIMYCFEDLSWGGTISPRVYKT